MLDEIRPNTKLNKYNYIKAELVGVGDKIYIIIWYGYILSEQGYQVRDNNVYQYNQSTTTLAKNIRALSRNRTRQ